jgi:ATP-dependent exoDNAse (exonuclease V) beta subunit
MQTLTLYKSSAGSGKTFTLVLEYLKLVLPEPGTFRSVLAVTFTNKATEEMKTRIIRNLSELSDADSEDVKTQQVYRLLRAHFDAHGHRDLDIQAKARETLNRILNDYTSFSVTTIESFFQRIVRAFARELNIPLGYDVEMQQDLVLEQLVDELFVELGTHPSLTRLLEGFVRRNLEEERSWNVDVQVKSLGRQIFTEQYQRQALKAPAEGDRMEETLALADEVWAIRRRFETQMETAARQGLAIMEDHALAADDFTYKDKGVGGYFQHVLAGNYVPGQRAQAAYDAPEKWYSKASKRKQEIEAALNAGLMDALRELIDTYEAQFAAYNTALQVSRTIYSFGLLSELQDKLADYRREHNLQLISDTSFLLSQVIGEDHDTPFVYEKVGTRFRHYLLDEFQDTSDLQWENLFPLVSDALAQGDGSLIVGDAKQSIYRWRSGNMLLLLMKVQQQVEARQQPVDNQDLANNYRTAGEIVRFNNQFFVAAAAALGQKFPEAGQDLFDRAYQSVVQTPQKNHLPGYVCLDFLVDRTFKDDPEVPTWKAQALDRTLEVITELIAEGFRGGEITLLMRTNRDGVEVAEYLQRHGVAVVSAESLLIVSDPNVRLLQALLQHLNHEQDPIALAALGYYYARVVHGRGSEHETFAQQAIAGFSDQLAARKPALRQLPVYECVEQLLHLLPDHLRHPNAYVQGFMDCVLEYSASQDASIAGFLAWWAERQHKRAIAAAPDPDAVQIMTMHKAKGLEFPVVILPFAEWELTPKPRGILWVEPQEPPYNRFPFLPVHPSSKLEQTQFAQAYAFETLEAHLDSLNLLYVAFTRPQYRLYAFTKKVSDPSKLNGIAALLNHLAMQGDLGGVFSGEDLRFACGTAANREQLRQLSGEAADQLEASTPLRPNLHTSSEWNQKIRVRYQSSQFLHTDLVERRGRIDEGELIHEALAHITTTQDLDQALDRLIIRGLLPRTRRDHLRARLQQVMALPVAATWYDGSWQVRNEADIILADGSVLRPDRVMLRGQQAVVVDYKSGQPFASHGRQLQRYIETLRELGYGPVQGYVYYLGAGTVTEVTA